MYMSLEAQETTERDRIRKLLDNLGETQITLNTASS